MSPQPGPPLPGPEARAPRLLPLAFVSGVLTAVPVLLYVTLFGVLNIDIGRGSAVVLGLATLVCLVGPVVGIVAGIRAVRRCRSLPRTGGGLLVAGCALQALLMITLCLVLPMVPRVWLALVALIVGGLLPALLNLVGGILGRQGPPAD